MFKNIQLFLFFSIFLLLEATSTDTKSSDYNESWSYKVYSAVTGYLIKAFEKLLPLIVLYSVAAICGLFSKIKESL
jgi:hypothetical protein